MNNQETIDQVKEIATEHAKRLGNVIPCLFVKAKNREKDITVIPIVEFPEEREEKRKMFKQLGKRLSNKDFVIDCIILSAEFKKRDVDTGQDIKNVLVLMLDSPENNKHKMIKKLDINRGKELSFSGEEVIQEKNCGFMDFKILQNFWVGYYA